MTFVQRRHADFCEGVVQILEEAAYSKFDHTEDIAEEFVGGLGGAVAEIWSICVGHFALRFFFFFPLVVGDAEGPEEADGMDTGVVGGM